MLGLSSVPFSFGSICRLWPCVDVVQQQVRGKGMEAHNSPGVDARRLVEDDRHQVALVEEVVPYQLLEDMGSLDARDPFIFTSATWSKH